MRNLRVKATVMAMAFLSLTAMSCRDSKKVEVNDSMHSEMPEKGHHDDSMMDHDDSMMNENDSTMNHDSSMMNHDKMDTSNKMQNSEAKQVLADYMVLKDALVETDEKAAATAGKRLENTLKSFKVESYSSEQQKALKNIIEASAKNAVQISTSDIVIQRENFEKLTANVIEMVGITGTENILYQQFCPMYNDGDGKGGAWLSMEKNIKNPYFGSKMMTCGVVQKEIK